MSDRLKRLGIEAMGRKDRLELIADLNESMPDEPPTLETTPAWHMEEIQRRLADHEVNPGELIDYNVFREQLRKRS